MKHNCSVLGVKHNSIRFALVSLYITGCLLCCPAALRADTLADVVQQPCSVFVQNGDTVSIYHNWEDNLNTGTATVNGGNILLVDGENTVVGADYGKPACAILNNIAENALWRVVMDMSTEADKWSGTGPDNTKYGNGYGQHGKEYRIALQNIKTGRWLFLNAGQLYLTAANSSKMTYFSHEHSYTVYRWEDNYVTLGKLFYTAGSTKYYLTYDRLSEWKPDKKGDNATVRFAKWTKCDEKVATVEAVLNENDSKVSKDEADKRNFYYFPFACWKTGGIAGSTLEKATDLGLTDKYSQRYATGYEEQKAVYALTPTVAHRVYYRCLATNSVNGSSPLVDISKRPYDFLLMGKTIIIEDTELPAEAASVTFSARWGTRGANPTDPHYSRLTTDLVKDRKYMETDRKPNLSLCGFDEDTINQYIETAPRNMMQYTMDDNTLTVSPVGVSPWNVYATKEDGKTKGWYYYLDTLTVSANAPGCKSQSIRLPIGRESFHIACECQLESAVFAVKGDNSQSYDGGETFFDVNGGDWKIEIDSLTLFMGIGLFDMDTQEKSSDGNGGVPLLFRTNTNKFARYVIDNGGKNGKRFNCFDPKKIILSYKDNGGNWLSQSENFWVQNKSTVSTPQIDMLVLPLASGGADYRTQDVKLRINNLGWPTNSGENGWRYISIETVHTISQNREGYGVDCAAFNTQTGRFYSVRDSNQHQQVHTYEQTIYYVPAEGREYTLKLKEPNFFGYMRWYDFNTGKDPKYQPDGKDADGKDKFVLINDFWSTLPATNDGNKFGSFNTDAEHSYGLYYLFPKTAGEQSTDRTRANSPVIRIPKDENFSYSFDIACDVSNYTDYKVTRDNNGNLVSFTEPTLSYRQIFHFSRGDSHESNMEIQEVADSLAKCTTKTGRFYEEHEYEMPVGMPVELITNRMLSYANGARSLDKYWLKMDDNVTSMQDGVNIDGHIYAHTWKDLYQPKFFLRDPQTGQLTETTLTYAKKDGYYCDYINVNSNSNNNTVAESREYACCLVPKVTFGDNYTGDTILLVLHKVQWVNRDPAVYGPSETPLITLSEIEKNYVLLSKHDFDFNKPGTTVPTLYNVPLNPEESTMGFVPSRYIMRDRNNPRQYTIQREKMATHTDFPNYGEYCFINIVGTDNTNGQTWLMEQTQHTAGPEDGYALYADGTDQAGQFLSLNTDAKLCSGQQMYCSMWLCNPSTDGYYAEFEVVMEGRNEENGVWQPWEEVKSFYIGKMASKTPWRQVRFPVDTRTDYEESRIVFYNFASGNAGNNYMVDDVYLYASRIPLEAFQVNTTCMVSEAEKNTSADDDSGVQNPIHGLKETDNVATIIRVDYEKLIDGFTSKHLYYQIREYYTQTPCTEGTCEADSALQMNYRNDFGEDNDNRYGVIQLPNKSHADGWEPQTDKFASLDAFLEYVAKDVETAQQTQTASENDDNTKGSNTYIGYVPVTDHDGQRYVIYIVQMLKMHDLDARHRYEVCTAYTKDDLRDALCSMRTDLPVYEPTAFEFNGETYPTVGQCANERYPLEIIVRQEIVTDGDHSLTLEANARAEWLKGYTFDSIYYNAYQEGLTTPTDKEAMAAADEAFLKQYGYPRKDVDKAIDIMRRDPVSYPNATNYYVEDYHDLKKGQDYWGIERPEGTEEDYYYTIITTLCEKGLLRLALKRDDIYLLSNDTVCYWIYPTAGTAQTQYEGTTYILNQCASPKFVMVYSKPSDNKFTFGLKEEDIVKGVVPRIRVTEYDANHRFAVPCYIGDKVVIEWDSTKLDATGTNDPVILEKMTQKGFSMHYTQNIIYTKSEDKYYKPEGDTVYFTPVDEAHVEAMKELHATGKYGTADGHPGCWVINTDTMRAGYQYTLRSQMKPRPADDFDDITTGDTVDKDGCITGYAYFTLVVVPDTLIWTPKHESDGYYYWGEDRNWSGLVNGQVRQDLGYAPIKSSVVIIPEGLDPEKYPYIDDVKVDAYSKDINYLSNVCKKVQFRKDVRIIGQHHLQYDSAYVDMNIRPVYSDNFGHNWGGWNAVSAPLQGMYAGDFYIPHQGMWNNGKRIEMPKKTDDYTQDFRVDPFQGTRSSDAAYAFWARYYDKEVYNYTDANYYEDAASDKLESVDAGFYTSNRLNQPLNPGEGFALYALGMGEDSLEVRLPKPDTKYFYYKTDGTALSGSEETPRTNSYRLAYKPDDSGNMTITLTNRTAGNYFLLGNPTMSYLNVAKLMEVNSGKLAGAFYILEDGKWKAGAVQLSEWWEYPSRYIAPMQAVMLKTNDAATELQLTITPGCLSLTNISHTEQTSAGGSSAPKRAKGHLLRPQIMHISAYTDEAEATATLALMDFADNGYQPDEDVSFLSTGIEGDKTSGVLTPVNIYTLAGNRTLAVDIRNRLDIVPLGFVIDNDYRTDSIVLSFGFNIAWGEECYLCDTLTGARTRIHNDLRLRVATPRNHEIRYYIVGANRSPGKPDTPTEDEPVVIDKGAHVTVCSPQTGEVEVVADGFVSDVHLYDVTGRLVAVSSTDTNTPTVSLRCPSGVMFADVRLRSGATYRTKVFVR